MPICHNRGARFRSAPVGPDNLQWQSASLELAEAGQQPVALLSQGRHEISVRDPATGKEARTWIVVLTR